MTTVPAPRSAGQLLSMPLPRIVMRRDSAGLHAHEQALARAGFVRIAGADEAGRGACAGPLVVAACLLAGGRKGRIEELADSKVLTPAKRERLYEQIVARALGYSVVIVAPHEIDTFGLHVMNLQAMRRAIWLLEPRPDYALTDGFAVTGLGIPSTAVWKGDAVVACVAAASILAKVTRDRIMVELHQSYPEYDFARHKGYSTAEHTDALRRFGPSPVHRFSYVNVRQAADVFLAREPVTAANVQAAGALRKNGVARTRSPRTAGDLVHHDSLIPASEPGYGQQESM